MPGMLVAEFEEAMDTLEARELRNLKLAVQMGTGSIDTKHLPELDQVLKDWVRRAYPWHRVRKASPADLARMGIGYEEVG